MSLTSSGPLRYGVAVLAASLALLARLLLDPILPGTVPFLTLFPAIAVTVWYGGAGPALLATGLGYLGANYLFISPRRTLGFTGPEDLVSLLGYLGAALLIVVFGAVMHRARRQAEQSGREYQRERNRLRTTLGSIGDAVVATDPDGRVTFLNGVAERLTGWTAEEAGGQELGTVFRIVNEATGASAENPVGRVLREGMIVGLGNHTILISRDGTRVPIDDSAAPIREGNDIIGVVLVFRDVSERRASEKALRESEARKAAFLETSLDGIVTIDFEGRILEFNPAAERMFGYRREQIVGQSLAQHLIPPALRDRHHQGLARYLATGEGPILDARIEMPALRSDGTEFPVELTVTRILTPGMPIFTAYIRDLTDRARNERRRIARLAVSQLLAHVDSIEEAAPSILETIGRSLGWEVGALWLVDPDSQVLRCETFWHNPAVSVPRFERVSRERTFAPGIGFPGRIWRSRKPSWIPDVTRDDNFPRAPYAVQDGLHGALGFPIEHGAELFGIMEFFSSEIREPDPDLLEMVHTLGGQIGQLLERRRIERRTRDQLREADRKKDEFLAILSHELRNPLAPLRHALELLRWGHHEPRVREPTLEVMERQLKQMIRLVDDLLDLSRITRGTMELRKEPVDLAAVIRSALEASRPLIEERRHRLELVLPEEPLRLEADVMRLAQVFSNLLNNAAKYTDPGGRITLEARRQGTTAEVRITDTGIGIPADKLSGVFETFSQVDQPLARSQGGLGVGLTLVRRLVELHGGTVQARSDGPGRGSEFVVRVPLGQPSEAPRPAAEPVPLAASGTPRRILVVDDNRDAAATLGLMLDLMGHEIRTAFDGEAAVEAAASFHPDIVLLDIGLPKLNGYETCRRIRQESWGRAIPIIALTGWGQEADRRRAREAGFNAHLVKPVERLDLERVLGAL